MSFNITFIFLGVTVISSLFILMGSIKLVRSKDIPGSKLIFISILGYILSIFILGSDTEIEELPLTDQILIMGTDAVLILMATYGFYLLASYVASNSANN